MPPRAFVPNQHLTNGHANGKPEGRPVSSPRQGKESQPPTAAEDPLARRLRERGMANPTRHLPGRQVSDVSGADPTVNATPLDVHAPQGGDDDGDLLPLPIMPVLNRKPVKDDDEDEEEDYLAENRKRLWGEDNDDEDDDADD